MLKLAFAIIVSIAFQIGTVSAGVIVYSNDFDGGEAFSFGTTGGFSGVATTESVQGYSGIGTGGNVFSENFLRNTSGGNPVGTNSSLTTLRLSNLPSHTSIDLKFLFAAIDSWDVMSSADSFFVQVDGITVFEGQFTSNPDQNQQGYVPPLGVQLLPRPFPQLGFNEGFEGRVGFDDGAYNLGLEPAFSLILHTGDTLTIDFFAGGSDWQGGGDESFAIENVSVVLNGVTVVPEPSSLMLFIIASTWAALGVIRMKRAGMRIPRTI